MIIADQMFCCVYPAFMTVSLFNNLMASWKIELERERDL